jgi:hypothetical protein
MSITDRRLSPLFRDAGLRDIAVRRSSASTGAATGRVRMPDQRAQIALEAKVSPTRRLSGR